MKTLRIGPLDVMLTSNDGHPVLYLDWRMAEVGNRWRVQISTKRLWTSLFFPRATKHSRWPSPIYWAYWAKGNEG